MLLSCSHYKEKGERHGRCEPMCEKTTRLRDARTMRERLHDLRRLGGRTAHTVRKPVAHARWDRVGFVGKARAIRVGNRGTPRGKRAGTALDSHQIREEFPLDPRQQNVRWRRYNGRAGPRKRNNEPEEPLERIAMPEICTFYGIRITINWEKNAPHHKPHFHAPTEASRRYTRRKESCLQASFLPARRDSS